METGKEAIVGCAVFALALIWIAYGMTLLFSTEFTPVLLSGGVIVSIGITILWDWVNS
jgi:hypothetical protein